MNFVFVRVFANFIIHPFYRNNRLVADGVYVAVGVALIGLLAWAVVRSKAPAPSMSAEIEAPKKKSKKK